MPRSLLLAAAGILLAIATANAAEPTLAGSWRLHIPLEGGQDMHLLVNFKEADGKWVGAYLGSSPKLRGEMKFGNLTIKGRNVQFTLRLGDREFVSVDGLLAADGKKINGSVRILGNPPRVTELMPSKLTKL